MNPSPTEFKNRSLEAALDLLWRQWCSLGVAGNAPPAEPSRIIDPEALLLATTHLGRHDPRLLDECLDWLCKHGSLIHLQRLKTLHADTGLGDPAVLAAMADWLATEARQPKWRAVAKGGPIRNAPRILFGGNPPESPDPVFLRHGLLREKVSLRGMSRSPNPTLPPNLLLALRALIGVGARAEVILCLATGPAVHAAELARLTGYRPRTMQLLLQEMTLSGHVLTQEPPLRPSAGTRTGRGSSRRYHLQAGDWSFLTGGKPLPHWMPWTPLWRIVQEIIDAHSDAGDAPRHPALTSSQLREVLASQSQELAAAGLLPLLDIRAAAPGSELLATLAERLPQALDGM